MFQVFLVATLFPFFLVLHSSMSSWIGVVLVAGLRKKTVSIAGGAAFSQASSSGESDLFGGTDVAVKHQLEGHTRGVNWASFHKTSNLIVSGADDREVKLWRYSG